MEWTSKNVGSSPAYHSSCMSLDSVSLAAIIVICYISNINTKALDQEDTLLSLETAGTQGLKIGGRFQVLGPREVLRHIYI